MTKENKKKERSRAESLALTGLFAAIVCIATIVIKIPIPATQGYIHFGDGFVFLAGIIPGGGFGMLAAGIGSALADIFSGYVIYAPVTFAVKVLCAMTVWLFYKYTAKKVHSPMARLIIGGIVSVLILTAGYLAFETVIYGTASLIEIPANLVQGGSGILISTLLYPLLKRISKGR